ncbi:hypothetical protein [Spartinivicinus ruber]|uniref:hypothetical protein n=1 Tax=Spartinivicinus ruber TaxID=2683272 RepID=UPI0013D3882D|nr:hypothetical protein [Spartinivicinus ruber]
MIVFFNNCLFSLTLLYSINALANSTLITVIGTAVDHKTRQPLYQEHHQFNINQLTQVPITDTVKYYGPNDQLLAKKTVNYKLPKTPNIEFIDYRLNYQQRSQVIDNTIIITEKVENKIITNTQTLLDKNTIVDAGFDSMIKLNWQPLTQDKNIKFRFIALFNGKSYGFVAKKIQQSEATVSFHLALDNMLLRWIADPIEVTYNKQTKRLLRYQGISNLLKNPDENYVVDISYTYQ